MVAAVQVRLADLQEGAAMSQTDKPVAYLAQGKLYVLKDGTSMAVESAFGQEILSRAQQAAERRNWRGGVDDGMNLFAGRMLWGGQIADSNVPPLVVMGIAGGPQNHELTYVLDTGVVGALLRLDLESGKERRLFHKANFHCEHLAMRDDGERIACSVLHQDGTSGIGIMEADGSGLHTITEGDSLDQVPSWVPGIGTKLLYQSAGFARDGRGVPAGIGPYCIEKLDMRTGEITTLLEDHTTDFLMPHMDAEGKLYVIERPYKGIFQRPTIWSYLKDIVFFPFRLLRVVFGFLNIFSVMFSGKPLTTSTAGRKTASEDLTRFMLHGRWVDATKAVAEGDEAKGAIVPKEWEMVCYSGDELEQREVLAESIVAMDLTGNELVYTNGRSIFHRDLTDHETRKLGGEGIIQNVTLLQG